jgi:putative aldouronate transport system substrate-binding protein
MKKNKMVWMLVIILSLILVISACSNNKEADDVKNSKPTNTTNTSDTPAVKGEDPVEFSVMIDLLGGIVPEMHDEFLQTIEDFTNVKLDIQWAPNGSEVLPVQLASGDHADIVGAHHQMIGLPYMVNAMRGGVFWELTDIIKDYPNLSNIDDIYYKNTSLDGKIYGLPRVRDIARSSLIFRQDWLDNLGMSAPQTIDELKEMFRAFTFDDPDRNGKDDTTGFILDKDYALSYFMASYPVYFGAPNIWGLKDDNTFYSSFETPEFLESLQWLRSLNDEGLVNSDFPALPKGTRFEMFEAGSAGAMMDVIDAAQKYEDRMDIGDRERGTLLSTESRFDNGQGIKIAGTSGHFGVLAFTKKGFPTEQDLRRALTFFDQLATEEMNNLFTWGIEGIHYEMKDGIAHRINQELYA